MGKEIILAIDIGGTIDVGKNIDFHTLFPPYSNLHCKPLNSQTQQEKEQAEKQKLW